MFDIEKINQALLVLHSNQTNSNSTNSFDVSQVDTYLKKFQESSEAQSICTSILSEYDKYLSADSFNASLNLLFFASQTLNTKVARHLAQIPNERKSDLRDALLNFLLKYSKLKGTYAIRKQLSIALASLAIQLTEQKNSIIFFIENFRQEHPQILLDLLTVIPEELQKTSSLTRTILSRERYNEICKEFGKYSRQVLSLLDHYMTLLNSSTVQNANDNLASLSPSKQGQKDSNKNQMDVQQKIFECFAVQIDFGELEPQDLSQNMMIDFLFNALQSDSSINILLNSVVEALSAVTWLTKENVLKYQSVVEKIFSNIPRLEAKLEIAIKNRDYEIVEGLCRIFSSIGTSYVEIVAQGSEHALKLLKSLLQCLAYPDIEISLLTLNFWFDFIEFFNHLKRQNQFDSAEKNQSFTSVFQALVASINEAIKYTGEDLDKVMENDQHCNFRYDCSDLLQNLTRVYDVNLIYKQLIEILHQSTVNPSQRNTEAVFYSIYSILNKFDYSQSDIAFQIMEIVSKYSSQPSDNATQLVRASGTRIFGVLSRWLVDRPDLIGPVLEYVVAGLNSKQVSRQSSLAFLQICSRCSHQIKQHYIENVFEVFDKSWVLSVEDRKNIIEGLSCIISLMNASEIQKYFPKLTQQYVQMLCQDVTDMNYDSKTSIDSIFIAYDCLGHIFKSLEFDSFTNSNANGFHQKQQTENFLNNKTEIFALFLSYFEQFQNSFIQKSILKYQKENDIMESVCRLIKQIIRKFPKEFMRFVSPVLSVLESVFKQYPHSCLLYFSSVIVDEYAHLKESQELLMMILDLFVPKTLLILQKPENFAQNPDICDDFFRLSSRFLEKSSNLFIMSKFSEPIFICAINGLSILEHREAFKSLSNFLIKFIAFACGSTKEEIVRDQYQSQTNLESVIQVANNILCRHDHLLVGKIIEAIQKLTHHDVNKFCRMLEILYCKDSCKLQNLMKQALENNLPQTVSPNVKQIFFEAYFKSTKEFERFDSIQDFQRSLIAIDRQNRTS